MTKVSDEEIQEAMDNLDPAKFISPIQFEITGLQLICVHGCLCLGLRHPLNKGPSRILVLQFMEEIERKMLEIGMIQRSHLAIMHKVEIEESEKLDGPA